MRKISIFCYLILFCYGRTVHASSNNKTIGVNEPSLISTKDYSRYPTFKKTTNIQDEKHETKQIQNAADNTEKGNSARLQVPGGGRRRIINYSKPLSAEDLEYSATAYILKEYLKQETENENKKDQEDA